MQRVAIIALAGAFVALVLHRKTGPGEVFASFRRQCERNRVLRPVFGEHGGCETCATFWICSLFFVVYAFCPPSIFFFELLAAAGLGLWLAPTMAAQIGQREE